MWSSESKWEKWERAQSRCGAAYFESRGGHLDEHDQVEGHHAHLQLLGHLLHLCAHTERHTIHMHMHMHRADSWAAQVCPQRSPPSLRMRTLRVGRERLACLEVQQQRQRVLRHRLLLEALDLRTANAAHSYTTALLKCSCAARLLLCSAPLRSALLARAPLTGETLAPHKRTTTSCIRGRRRRRRRRGRRSSGVENGELVRRRVRTRERSRRVRSTVRNARQKRHIRARWVSSTRAARSACIWWRCATARTRVPRRCRYAYTTYNVCLNVAYNVYDSLEREALPNVDELFANTHCRNWHAFMGLTTCWWSKQAPNYCNDVRALLGEHWKTLWSPSRVHCSNPIMYTSNKKLQNIERNKKLYNI